MYFLAAVALTGAGMGLWIKQAFDTRPKVDITEPAIKATAEQAVEPAVEPPKQ